MVWSNWNWKGAVLVVLSGVGLAWSQVPTSRPLPSSNPGERIVTVHENGKALRCRMITTWKTQANKAAYQVQVIDSGEMLTIEEDGQATTVAGGQTNAKALPMRIYHWGASKTPPAGSPLPPQVVTASNNVTVSVEPTVSTPTVSGNLVATGKEKVVWWEEKNGQRVSPTYVTSGHNPFENKTTIAAPAVQTACDTSCTEQPKVAVKARLGERLGSIFQRSGTISKPADPVQTVDKGKAPDRLPFSTADGPKSTGKTLTNADLAAAKDTKTLPPGKSVLEQSVKNAEKKSGDVLLDPERFDKSEKKRNVKTAGLPPVAQNDQPLPNVPADFPGQPLGGVGQMPMGAQSVIAAGSGVPTRMTYVPVPVWNQPEPTRPPNPPPARIPDPPQPTAFVNAFMPQPNMPKPAPGIQPNMQPMMMAQGNPMMQPQMAQMMQMPNGYGMPGAPMMPMMQMPQRPMAQVNYPAQYQGPMPPNPFQGQIQQTGYAQPGMPMPQQMNPAMDRRFAPAMPMANQGELAQLFHVLKESMFPAQREWAANTLSAFDARQNPEIVAVLLDCAKQDSAATVRAGCVYSLSRMGVVNEPIVNALQMLRQDSDPRVRAEVEQGLQRLGVATNR